MKRSMKEMYDFLERVEKLKQVSRYSGQTGLIESVADHGYRVAMMISILGPDNDVNVENCAKMAMVSVLDQYNRNADARQKLEPAEKVRQEKKALQDILVGVPKETANDVRFKYREFSTQQSRDAQFVKAVKDLEALMHIVSAGHETYTDSDIIPNYADKSIAKFPRLIGYLVEAKARLKKEFEKNRIEWHEEYDEMIL